MNKIALSACTALLCSAATGAMAYDSYGYKDVCWEFSKLDQTNPYPTDRIQVKNALQKVCKYKKLKLECQWNPVLDTPLSGRWVQSLGSPTRSVIVPLVGTMVSNSYPVTPGVDPSLVIDFHGSIQDLSLNSPFTYPCNINGLVNPDTLNSPTSTGEAPFPTGYPGYVFAACPGYFSPVEGYSPFTTPLFLKSVSCDAQVW